MTNNSRNHDIDEYIVPGGTHSYWIDTSPNTEYASLKQNVSVDTVIIGGGIVGISVAKLLKEAGQTVAIVEAGKILHGVTGHTTAKITALHGTDTYRRLLRTTPKEQAALYAEANSAAIEHIAENVATKKIECDFKRTTAYSYTESSSETDNLKAEADAAQRLGLPVSYVNTAPLPFEIKGAVRLDNQAQFHPCKYLLALANDIPGDGSYIFENSRAIEFTDGDPCEIATNDGRVRAKDIVLASAYPIHDTGHFYTKLYPYVSYLTAVEIEEETPDGIFYSENGIHHTMRNIATGNRKLLIVGGGNHKTGQGGDTVKRYREVLAYAIGRFKVLSLNSYWSTEDYSTPDGVPYIGKAPQTGHIYMASGFAGWGMTTGTFSAMLISDLILQRASRYRSLFDPSRHRLSSFGKKFFSEGLNITSQYAKEFTATTEHENPENLAPGEGKIIRIDDKKVAAFKDENGKLFLLSASCTHLGCPLVWNNAERTWDCTCHGSRFNFDGSVIHGPAENDLKNALTIAPEKKEGAA